MTQSGKSVGVASTPFGSVKGEPGEMLFRVKGTPSIYRVFPDAGNEYVVPDITAENPGANVVPATTNSVALVGVNVADPMMIFRIANSVTMAPLASVTSDPDGPVGNG